MLDAFLVHPVDFSDHHRTALDMQQIQDIQVFQRLWHHTVISGDYQQRIINATNARKHIAHKTFMTRHVHKADQLAIRQR